MRAVVVIEPEAPENLGFIARLAENFEFDIRVVNPKFNLKEARKTANNAQEKLRNARIFDSVEASVKDLDFVVGTKPRKGIVSREFNFRDNTSIMLGRESSGLTKEELELCDAVVHIDASYDSLNLSHAASVLMYEAYDSKGENAESSRLEFIEDKYGENLRNLLGRGSPTDEELDRVIGELNQI